MVEINIVQVSQKQRKMLGQFNKCHNLILNPIVFWSQFTQPLVRRSWAQYDKISLQQKEKRSLDFLFQFHI